MKWVRALIALVATLGITVGFFLDKVDTDAYIGLMAVAITWWFKARDEEKRTE